MRNRLLLLAAAVLFSTGGAAIKATSLTGWQVAGFRSAIAALVLLLFVPQARANWNWRIAPAGIAYSLTLLTFVLANKLTTSANAVFLQSTAPLYLLLLGPLLLREPIRRSELALIVTVALGLAFIFTGQQRVSATAPDPVRGNLIGAVSGLAWAATVTGLRWLGSRKGPDPSAGAAAGNLLGFLIALPMALPARIGAQDLAVILYLGVFQVGLAYIWVTRAIRHVPALEAAILLLAEPALNPVWAYVVHGERPGGWALAGGALILAASLANAWRKVE